MHYRPSLVVASAAVICGTVLAACGGSSTSTTETTAAVSTVAETVAPETTAAPASSAVETTVATASTEPAEFDGPSFPETVAPALAPYDALIGASPDSPDVRAVLSALGDDVPLPAGLTVNGIGHRLSKDFGELRDEQSASFNEYLDKAQLEAFGKSVGNGWKQASIASSRSLTTLLLTHTDGRRLVFVSDSEALPSGSGRAPLQMEVFTTTPPDAAPAWFASLPSLRDGEVVEYTEASGRISDNLVGSGQFVLVRWRYPTTQLDALNAYLASGVVQTSGFSYDKDTFNGFEALVDVANGDWKGTVLIGNANIDGVDYYDLVWSLSR
ncbi:MAG: hypothetical protein ACKOD2_08460, partial [Ilumatobacteraceae bacterium]